MPTSPKLPTLINADGSITGYTYSPSTLEVASGDSTASLSASKFTGDITGNAGAVSVGSSSDPWAISQAVANNPAFAFYIRRSLVTGENANTPRYAASLALDIYYTVPLINADASILGYTYEPSSLEVAYGTSLAGLGESEFTGDITGNAIGVSVGSVSDPWALDPMTVNMANFCFFVRRPTTSSENTATPRYVASLALDIYYNAQSGGSLVAERTTVHQSSYFGKELVKGTSVATPNRFVSLNVQPQPAATIKELRGAGDKLPYDEAYINEWCTLPAEGFPSYNETPWILSSLISQPQTGLVPGSTSAYHHTLNLNTRQDDPVNTLTIVYGDQVRCHQASYGQFTECGFTFNRTDSSFSANGVAQRITDNVTFPTGQNESQTLTITGGPTGGTMRLGFRGAQTADLQILTGGVPITAAALQAALQALPTIGAGNVTVSGALTGAGSITGGSLIVTFAASLAGLSLPVLAVAPQTAMTGGASPAVVMSETVRGGFNEIKVQPILPGQLGVYLSSTLATLSSNKMTRLHISEMKISNKAKAFWTINDSNSSFTGLAEIPMDVEIKLTAQADSVAMGILGDLRAGNTKYIQLAASTANAGITIDGVNPFSMAFTAAMKVASAFPFKDEQGIYATEFTLKSKFDLLTNLAPNFQFVNDISGY